MTDVSTWNWRPQIWVFATLLVACLAAPHAKAQERAPLPKCWPTSLKAQLEAAPSDEYVLFWVCESPRGLSHYALFFDWSRAAEWASRGILAKEIYDAAYGERSRLLTIEEQRYAYGPHDADGDGDDDSLVTRYGARAAVSPNSTSLSRPVYAANADGTRNTTAVTGARVAVNAPCNYSDRLITTTGVATKYYSVEGRENVATPEIDTLGKVYAVCTLTVPLGLN